MDSKEFVKSYTKRDIEEKLSKTTPVKKKLDYIYFVISELEAFGVKHIKIRDDAKDRYLGIVVPFEMKISYQFLKAKQKYFERCINNQNRDTIKKEVINPIDPETKSPPVRDIVIKYLKKKNLLKKLLNESSKVNISKTAREINAENNRHSIGVYRVELYRLKDVKD